MVLLPVAERRFTFALMVSAAIHVALLSMILAFASASAPRHVRPVDENFIRAFLVQETLPAAGKGARLPGHKPREEKRTAPVAAAPRRELPEVIAPAMVEIEHSTRAAEIRPPTRSPGIKQETRGSPVPTPVFPASSASLPSPSSTAAPLLVPEGGGLSGTFGTAITQDRLGGGESSGANGAVAPASRRAGVAETRQPWDGTSPPPAATAVPRYADNARPAYPPLARLRGYQGGVLLMVEVLADGRVGRVEIRHSAGHEVLDRAALEAVRSWRFEPGRKEGRPVTMSVEVPIRFVLHEDPTG